MKNRTPNDKPLTVIFTGNGNVSKGAQEVFHNIGIEMVKPENLKKMQELGDPSKIYGTVIEAKHHLRNRKTGKFNWNDLAKNPKDYESNFAEKYAPYCSILINGIVWLPGQPRLLTNENLKNLPNLLAVSDVSADKDGSLEFMTTCTTLDKPFKFFDTDKMEHTDDMMTQNNEAKQGFVYCSVDNMPTQVAKEATSWFGDGLLPLMPSILAASDTQKNFDQLRAAGVKQEILQAIITSDGKLTPRFEYIEKLRTENDLKNKDKSALVLGAGMVTGPLVEYLDGLGVKLTLASAKLDEIDALIDRCQAKNASGVTIDLREWWEKSRDIYYNILQCLIYS